MRRVPAVLRADRFQPPVSAAGAGEAVVLDIVGQQDLALGMERQPQPDQQARQPGDERGQPQRDRSPRKISEVGVDPGPAGPGS